MLYRIMKVNSNIGIFQCSVCGFMEDDFSYFHILRCEDDVICVGCYDNYTGESDIYIEDGE